MNSVDLRDPPNPPLMKSKINERSVNFYGNQKKM